MKNISSLHKQIADKYNIAPETVSKIENHIFTYIAQHMKNRKEGSILIHNFGTFRPSLNKTNREIRRQLRNYRKGFLNKEEITEKITKLWKIRNEALKYNSNE